MTKPVHVTIRTSDIRRFGVAHGMTPTGDPNEFWFRDDGGVYVAIVVFESAGAPDMWTGTIYTHPERSDTDIVESVRRAVAYTAGAST